MESTHDNFSTFVVVGFPVLRGILDLTDVSDSASVFRFLSSLEGIYGNVESGVKQSLTPEDITAACRTFGTSTLSERRKSITLTRIIRSFPNVGAEEIFSEFISSCHLATLVDVPLSLETYAPRCPKYPVYREVLSGPSEKGGAEHAGIFGSPDRRVADLARENFRRWARGIGFHGRGVTIVLTAYDQIMDDRHFLGVHLAVMRRGVVLVSRADSLEISAISDPGQLAKKTVLFLRKQTALLSQNL
jgi:hypothetical protein